MATAAISPPFRADHIGSLKRPVELLKLRNDVDAGKATKEQLSKLEDQVIKDQVQQLREIGIKSVTDGEFRRHMFFDGFFDNLDGMVALDDAPREIFKMYVPDVAAFFESSDHKKAASMICKAKLKRTKPMYRSQFEYVASLLPKGEVKNAKITLAAPEWFHLRHGEHAYDHAVYANDGAYFADIAIAYQEELKDLYDAGCRNVQFDDPLLAYFCSDAMLSGMKEAGVDSDALLDAYVKLYNDCLKGRPKDMCVGVHLCRGNFIHGRHFSEGGYEHISSKLFRELDADTYYLEYDTARAGGFEPLADLPSHKSVVLGLVSSKFPQLEDEHELIKKINEAVEVISKSGGTREAALQRICLSPQCGFASHSEGNDVTREDVKKKLSLVVKTAKIVWSDA